MTMKNERRKGKRKGMRYRHDYIILWGDIHSDWRLYRMGESFMDGWLSLSEHNCPKDGEVFSGHWIEEASGLTAGAVR